MESRRGWSQDEIQFIKDNYGKYEIQKISSMLSRSIASVSHKISKLGLDDPRCWTEDEDRILIENYEYNPGVWDLLPKRARWSIVARSQKFRLTRKCGNYPVNWRFFDDINNNSAYVVGFITADGCVEPHLRRLSISQAMDQNKILYDIRDVMECHNPIYNKNNRNESVLFIHNQHMVDRLVDIGIGHKKTDRTIFPNMDRGYESHFIRGVFDGDGSIYSDESHTGRVQFLGSEQLLSHIRTRLIEIGCSSKPVPHKRKVNTWCFGYCTDDDVVRIYDYLYKGVGIKLDRKYNKFNQIIRDITGKEPLLEGQPLEK